MVQTCPRAGGGLVLCQRLSNSDSKVLWGKGEGKLLSHPTLHRHWGTQSQCLLSAPSHRLRANGAPPVPTGQPALCLGVGTKAGKIRGDKDAGVTGNSRGHSLSSGHRGSQGPVVQSRGPGCCKSRGNPLSPTAGLQHPSLRRLPSPPPTLAVPGLPSGRSSGIRRGPGKEAAPPEWIRLSIHSQLSGLHFPGGV